METKRIDLENQPTEAFALLPLPVRMVEAKDSTAENEKAIYQVFNGRKWVTLYVKVLSD